MKLLSSAARLVALAGLLTCGTARQTTQQEPPPPAPKQGGEWRTYTPPDKSFSAEFPCEPERGNVSATSSPIYEYTCGGEDVSGLSFFTVSVLNISDAERKRMSDEAAFERSVRDSFTPNKRVVRMTPVKVEGGVGREFVVQDTTDDMDNLRGRDIIFGGRRYEVGFAATDAEALDSPAAERFFAAFKPLP